MNPGNVVGAVIVALVASPVVVSQQNAVDAALKGDVAVLSLLPEEVRSGRYSFDFGYGTSEVTSAPRWSGIFWRTPSGVYTRTEPYDEELVAREVSALVERQQRERAEAKERAGARRRATPTPTPSADEDSELDPRKAMPLTAGTFYRGSEYQYPLYDLFVDTLMPNLDPSVWTGDEACEAAVGGHTEAIRRAVNTLEPRFTGTGLRTRWSIDLEPLRRAVAPTGVAAESACGTSEGSGDADDLRLVVERDTRGLEWWWEVEYTQQPVRRRVEVTPGPVGPPPAVPDPAPRSPILNDFLRAVAACGEIPWEYSNFMAGNSFTPPGSKYFVGPNIFTDDWVCAKDVPPDELADPD